MGSYPTVSPLPAGSCERPAVHFSVALSSRSPSPGVTRHLALRSSDFPPARRGRAGDRSFFFDGGEVTVAGQGRNDRFGARPPGPASSRLLRLLRPRSSSRRPRRLRSSSRHLLRLLHPRRPLRRRRRRHRARPRTRRPGSRRRSRLRRRSRTRHSASRCPLRPWASCRAASAEEAHRSGSPGACATSAGARRSRPACRRRSRAGRARRSRAGRGGRRCCSAVGKWCATKRVAWCA